MPYTALIFGAIISGLPAAYYAYDWYSKRKLKRWLLANWGSDAALRVPDEDVLSDIAEYWHAVKQHEQPATYVDDTTWSDLDMNQVLRALDRSRSMVGSEVLYAMLRRQDADSGELRQRDALAAAFMADETLRLNTQMALHGIGYKAFHGATRYLYAARYQYPPHRWVYSLLGLLPLALLLLGFVDMRFVLAAGGAFAVNLFVFYRTQKTWEKELASIRHIGAVLRAAQRLARVDAPALQPYAAQMKALAGKLWAIRAGFPCLAWKPLAMRPLFWTTSKCFSCWTWSAWGPLWAS